MNFKDREERSIPLTIQFQTFLKSYDAGRKLLLPGFNDSHVHFISGGAQLDQIDLNDAATPEEFAKRIAAQVSKTAKGEWSLAGDWAENKWPKPQLTTRPSR